MGTWGTAVSSNDTYADIYSEFCDLYNDGMEVKEITAKLITEYADVVNDPDDAANLWLAIAKAQWDYKQSDSVIFDRVKEIIESGSNLETWKNLGASQKDIDKRKTALDKFLLSLQSEKPKAKARKKVKITVPYFEKGECIAFLLNNGNYGGAVILEALQVEHIGMNLIATTRMNQKEKPTLEDFERADVLVLNHDLWEDRPWITWAFRTTKTGPETLVERVGKINIMINYEKESSFLSGGFSSILHADRQFESEITKPQPNIKITIKSLIKKSFWKFW